ncbi:M16 family metallopeptidase [Pseudonocardia acaciae]|uniref:M16 family metallopeptidase n=1 Tax=Pseudonocardia acaciae TaxID=551276 RepID=UPI0006846821|nr:pitrilysin family protein [Pseudonocardia acaciae]
MTVTAGTTGRNGAGGHRGAEQIGHTETGPRPLPPLGAQRTVPDLDLADRTLPNGLRVIAVARRTVPTVELRLRIPFAGAEPTHPARAEMVASALLTGTAGRSRVEIDDELANIGGELAAGVDPERLLVSGSALAGGLPALLDVLADLLVAPAYPDGDFDRERERLVERIAVARSQPRTVAREALQRRRYGDHPASREMPLAEDVAAVASTDARELHRAAVLPAGSTLVLVGDVEPERAIATVADKLAAWAPSGTAAELPPLPTLTGRDLLLVDRPGSVQSQLRLSAAAVPRTDPSYPAVQLANLVLGGYFSSRLVENIREDKGYTYSASSYLEFTPSGATLLVETDVATDVTAAALLETRYELARLSAVPPTDAEVESARRYAIGSLLISLDSQPGLAATLAALAGVGLDAQWLRAHPARLEAVTPEQVARAAAEFFTPTAFTGVVVGDASAVGSGLRALGGVELP